MKSCENCDHLPSDCLSCETQIYNAWDNDITLLDEWARVARSRGQTGLSDGLLKCADLFAGLETPTRTDNLTDIAEALSSLKDDERVRQIRERFRKKRIELKNNC